MSPSLWFVVRELLGLPGKTIVKTIPSEELARAFFSAKNKTTETRKESRK